MQISNDNMLYYKLYQNIITLFIIKCWQVSSLTALFVLPNVGLNTRPSIVGGPAFTIFCSIRELLSLQNRLSYKTTWKHGPRVVMLQRDCCVCACMPRRWDINGLPNLCLLKLMLSEHSNCIFSPQTLSYLPQLTGHPCTERWLLGRDLTADERKEILHSTLAAIGCKLRLMGNRTIQKMRNGIHRDDSQLCWIFPAWSKNWKLR